MAAKRDGPNSRCNTSRPLLNLLGGRAIQGVALLIRNVVRGANLWAWRGKQGPPAIVRVHILLLLLLL
eukprot:9284186-Pyramimonas_sp.AAC.1